MPVGSETHALESVTPPTSGAVTPVIAREASSVPVTGSRRCTDPRPPPSASPMTRTRPSGLAPSSDEYAPGSEMAAVTFPAGTDTRSSRLPSVTHRAPPAAAR
jgi:hypothetical protein